MQRILTFKNTKMHCSIVSMVHFDCNHICYVTKQSFHTLYVQLWLHTLTDSAHEILTSWSGCDALPLVNGSWRFTALQCLLLQGQAVQKEFLTLTMKTQWAFKTPGFTHQMTQPNITEDFNPQQHCCQNLKSCTFSINWFWDKNLQLYSGQLL